MTYAARVWKTSRLTMVILAGLVIGTATLVGFGYPLGALMSIGMVLIAICLVIMVTARRKA